MGFACAYNVSTASYTVGSIHIGSNGGNITSTDYDARSTTTYEQPGNMYGQTANYLLNIGWYEGTNFTIIFGPMNISMLYPTNGSTFGPSQCSFRGTPNITFTTGSSNRNVVCSLFLNGVFQNNQSKNLTLNGPTNLTFTGLVTAGNYSMTCWAYDSINSTTNATAWANLWAMTGCWAQSQLGVTTSSTIVTTTYFYQPLVIPYFDIKNILFLLLLGCAVIGIVHYVQRA